MACKWRKWVQNQLHVQCKGPWSLSIAVAGGVFMALAAVSLSTPASATTFGARYERALNFVGGLEQVGLTADVPLAFHWQPLRHSRFQYLVQVSGGVFLDGSPDSRPFVEPGPALRLYPEQGKRWFIGFGVAPTLIGGSEFRDHRILGGSFFFTTHLVFGWRSSLWLIGIRFQHTSNADFDHPNPGVNMIGLLVQRRL